MCALQFFVSNNDYIPNKTDVGTMMDHPAEGWFSRAYGDERFDFVRLDNRDVVGYLSAGVAVADDPQ